MFGMLLGWQTLFAVTWAVLPARLSGDFSAQADGFETSRQLTLYLEYGGFKNFVPPAAIAGAYRALGLTPAAAISPAQAARIADHIDAERLLFLRVIRQSGQFSIESSIYHRESGLTTDSLRTSHPNLYQALGEHARLRFPEFHPPPAALPQNPDLILITEAGGGNYFELQQLARDIPALPVSRSALCATDPTGRLVSTGLAYGTATLVKQLRSLRARGNQAAQYVSHAAACAAGMARRHNLNKALFVLLVSDMPADPSETGRLKGHLRALSSHGKILILGSGSLSSSGQNYYRNLADDLGSGGKAAYRDILYRSQVGLANGESWYIFKRGDSILEGRESSERNAVAIPLPAQSRSNFRAEKLTEVYRDLSKNKIVSTSQTEILLLDPLLKFATSSAAAKPANNVRRMLLQLPEGSFWLSLPQAAFSTTNAPKIGDTLTLAVLLAAPHDGMPLINDPSFVKIFASAADVPRELYLPVAAFLQAPEKYLQHSIGGSSLYILQGRVVDIRLPRMDVLE